MTLESFKYECLSALDLKDAYHTIKILDSSKPHCDILSHFGLVIYQRMPLELSTSPAIWQSYKYAILSNISDRSKYLAIMDDLLLHSSKHGHSNGSVESIA